MAVRASVLLIVALLDAKWNQAAAHPAARHAQNHTEKPSEQTFRLIYLRHSASPAEVAINDYWVVWPLVLREGFLSFVDPLEGRHHHELLLLASKHLVWLKAWCWSHHDHLLMWLLGCGCLLDGHSRCILVHHGWLRLGR